MEELKTAISAMKQAEKALAKQGFTLKWKVRVKANRGFFRDMVNMLVTDTAVVTKKSVEVARGRKAAPKNEQALPGTFSSKKITKYARPETPKAVLEQTAPEQATETPQAAQSPEEEIDELQPITALDIQSAAAYLGISMAGVYDLIKRGRIRAHGKSGARWFKTEELDQYRQEREKRRAG
jgi:excisionase family DNA binding protein